MVFLKYLFTFKFALFNLIYALPILHLPLHFLNICIFSSAQLPDPLASTQQIGIKNVHAILLIDLTVNKKGCKPEAPGYQVPYKALAKRFCRFVHQICICK